MTSDDVDAEVVRIDELTVMEAGEAAFKGDGTIECPNGCYEPREINHRTLHVASELPHCAECGEMHVVVWEVKDDE